MWWFAAFILFTLALAVSPVFFWLWRQDRVEADEHEFMAEWGERR